MSATLRRSAFHDNPLVFGFLRLGERDLKHTLLQLRLDLRILDRTRQPDRPREGSHLPFDPMKLLAVPFFLRLLQVLAADGEVIVAQVDLHFLGFEAGEIGRDLDGVGRFHDVEPRDQFPCQRRQTGATGKEALEQVIHLLSQRRERAHLEPPPNRLLLHQFGFRKRLGHGTPPSQACRHTRRHHSCSCGGSRQLSQGAARHVPKRRTRAGGPEVADSTD